MAFDKARIFRSLASVAIAALAGWGLALAGVPLGWLIGSMLLVIVASFFKLPVEQPQAAVPFVKASVGTLLGASISLPVLASLLQWWPSLLGMFIVMLVAGAINFHVLRRWLGFAPCDAALCAVPGGIAEMILMSERAGADQRRVAIVHAVRIALSILSIPLLVGLIFGVEVQRSAASAPIIMALDDWLWFALCIGAGVLADRWTRFPAPLIIVPMLVCAALHIAGVTHFQVPGLVSQIIQVVIGMNVGARFQGISRNALANVALAALAVVTIQIIFAIAAALVVARLTAFDPLSLALAYSPGGLAEMSLIAVAMGREVAFVGVHHILRVLLCLATAPLLLNRLNRRP